MKRLTPSGMPIQQGFVLLCIYGTEKEALFYSQAR